MSFGLHCLRLEGELRVQNGSHKLVSMLQAIYFFKKKEGAGKKRKRAQHGVAVRQH
jgi:hypothetical protein